MRRNLESMTIMSNPKTVPGLTAKNFRKIAENGFGDRNNAYPHSMCQFGEHLYVGTTRDNLHMRGVGQDPNRVGAIWPVKLPERIWDMDLRAQIWRYNLHSGGWRKVYTSPMVRGMEGFDVPQSVGFRAMAVFQGRSDPAPALYVPTWATHQRPETLLLRSEDGLHYEVVSEPGLGLPDPKPRVLRGLIAFKGRLFATPAMGPKRREPNMAGVMLIVTSEDPRSGRWELACEPRFGNPNNLTVFHMEVFNGFLYAGTMNINEGYQVWKTDGEGKPPFRWRRVLTRGAYRGQTNQIAMTLRAFGDHLYVGSAIQHGGYDRNNRIGPAPQELVRINRDDSWDLVVGEPRLTPDGLKVPISGHEAGFGNVYGGYIWSMCVHEGWLYLGTAVWSAFLRYVDRSRWPSHLQRIFTPRKVELILKNFGGCDIWRSRDGYRWLPVTENGFDNEYNIGIRNMVSTDKGLFVGAANSFAPEVAVQKVAGWRYEDNPKGGLEIWLGSRAERGRLPASVEGAGGYGCSPLMTRSRKEDVLLERFMDQFFGCSGFRNFGYWTEAISEPEAACRNLLDEMMAFRPGNPGRLVDVGCGTGATTAYLHARFSGRETIGVTGERKLLDQCRRHDSEILFRASRLPGIALDSGSADMVTWCKGIWQLGSRPALVREAFRLLRPGGALICFDLIRESGKGRWLPFPLAEPTLVRSREEYERILAKTGFTHIRMVDVTYETLVSFHLRFAMFFDLKKYSGEMSEELYRQLEEKMLLTIGVRECYIIFAEKPGEGE
ncbi:MAG TPA: class I SAM-dependent methyltransferase [Desulfobulbus sp.]|nr:class I SAM-dependent methyltransferase [Desulfobulbus sp.]